MRPLVRPLLLALAAAALLLGQEALAIWRYGAASAATCPARTLLVMGAAQYDGRPSPVFRGRLDKALELFRAGCAERIVVSGGRQEGDRFSEGQAGVRYLRERGVPPEALVEETEASTSFENLRNAAPLLGAGPVVIVTDDLHAYRSRWLARRLGVDAEVAPVPTRSGRVAYGLRELVILTAYQLGVLR